jgi:hypothetical protein
LDVVYKTAGMKEQARQKTNLGSAEVNAELNLMTTGCTVKMRRFNRRFNKQ